MVVAGDAHEPRLKPLLSVVIDDSFHFHADDVSCLLYSNGVLVANILSEQLCSTVGIRTSDSYEAKTVDCALRFARPLDFMEFVHIVVSAKLQAAYATSRMQHQLEAVYTQLVPGVELANIGKFIQHFQQPLLSGSSKVEVDT